MAPRVALLRRQAAKLEAEQASLNTRLVELARSEQEAREAAIESAPSKRSDNGLSEVGRLIRKRKEAERQIENIQSERQALDAVLQREESAVADERLREAVAKAKPYRQKELAGWARLGELLAELHQVWLDDVMTVAETREQFAAQCDREGLLAGRDEELQSAFRAACDPPITPFPGSFQKLLDTLILVALDVGGYGYRQREYGHRADDANLLIDLIPDLQPRNRNAGLSKTPVSHANRAEELGIAPAGSNGDGNAASDAASAILAELVGEVG
jgi:hypothetical protein